MADWFIAFNGESLGPISAAELKQRALAGEISPETQICKAGTNKWAPASALKGLFPPMMLAGTATKSPVTVKSQPSPPPATVATASPQPQPVQAEVVPSPMMIAQAPVFAQPMQPGITMMFAAPQTAAAVTPVVTPSRLARFGRLIGTSIFLLLVSSIAAGIVFVTANKVSGLESEVEQLKEQRSALEGEKQELENAKRILLKQKEQLLTDIQNLTTMRGDLRQWQTMEVVMINPSNFAVGMMRGAEGGLVVTKISEDESAFTPSVRSAIKAAIHGGRAQFIPHDAKLTRDIAAEVRLGNPVEGTLKNRVEKYWNHRQIVDVSPGEAMRCVSFIDSKTRQRRMGLFISADSKTMTYNEPGVGERTIDRKTMIPGSAVRGTLQDIIPFLDESSFLDQCYLQVAQHVQPNDGNYAAHSVAVHVTADLPDLNAVWELEKKPLPEWNFRAEGWVAVGRNVVNVASGLQNLAMTQEYNQEIDRRRTLIRTLEEARFYLIDEVVTKLTKTGVNVVGREQHQHIAEALESGERNPYSPDSYNALPYSHVMSIRVQPPVGRGRYRLEVNLFEQNTKRTLSSENADRVDESIFESLPDAAELVSSGALDPLANTQRRREYFLDSGRLALLTVKETADDNYHPFESPLVVERTKEQSTSKLTNLVYVESGEGTFPLKYRALFSKRRYELDEEQFESIAYPTEPDDVPKPDIFRYCACRIARKTMPSAGRIRSIDGDGVIVSIGRETGVAVGDTMRLLRYFDDDYHVVIDELSGDESEAFLPIRLIVTEVHDDHCKMQVSQSGFEDIWPEDYEFREGDIVVPIVRRKPVIGILPPLGKHPDGKAKAAKAVDNMREEVAAVRNAMDLSVHFAQEMTDALNSMNIATREISNPYGLQRVWPHGFLDSDTLKYQIEAMRQAGVTHIVAGFLQPVGGSQYRMRIGIFPADYQFNKDTELTDTVDFKLNSTIIPK